MQSKMKISTKKSAAYLLENNSGLVGVEGTKVTFWHDKKNVYFEFVCDTIVDGYSSFGKKYNDKLWQGNVVEVFITLGDKMKYLEVETNPDGINYAVHIFNKDGKGDFDLTYLDEGKYSSTVEIKDNLWTTLMTIPFVKLEELGFDKNNAYINLYRQSHVNNDVNLYSYSPTLVPQFHTCSKFAKLTFIE